MHKKIEISPLKELKRLDTLIESYFDDFGFQERIDSHWGNLPQWLRDVMEYREQIEFEMVEQSVQKFIAEEKQSPSWWMTR